MLAPDRRDEAARDINDAAARSMLPMRISRPPRQISTLQRHFAATQELSTRRIDHSQRATLDVLELSIEKDGPAMPFLSPAIPAKHPKDERPIGRLTLATPSPEEYFGSFSSTSLHDSDSDDDDNFGSAKGRRNGLTSPHKVVNVPLPRTSGAAFGPNGSLIVFYPPRSRPLAASKRDGLGQEIEDVRQDKQRSMIALFPTFGNLFSGVAGHIAAPQPQDSQVDLVAVLGLDQASYSPRSSWQPQSTSAAPLMQSNTLPTVRVSIKQLTASLDPPNRELAAKYRVITMDGEAGSALCLANAITAAAFDRAQDVLIWQMLAKVTDDDKGRAATLWADHPLGRSWLVRRIYAVAERHGNVQMLANITASLIGSAGADRLASLGRLASRLAISDKTYEETIALSVRRTSIPKLQTELGTSKVSRRSPDKTVAGSVMSSRGPSQPTTPKLESSSSTPPWSFLTQPSVKAALANSISPETSRGSFSAAVKSYAQSVSDKFAAYGTSPPVRRSPASTGNELSTSLQSTGGSWAKSVSFASTTLTQRTSTLSRRTTDVDEDYDSDRTIDDALIIDDGQYDSTKGLQFIWKNRNAFTAAAHGSAKTILIPEDILPKCSAWTGTYVELLRSWGLTRQAVEMAKVGVAIDALLGSAVDLAVSASAESVTCGVCACLIDGLKQTMSVLRAVAADEFAFVQPLMLRNMSMKDSKRAEAVRLQGNECYKNGQLDEAKVLYEQAHGLDPQQAAPLSNLAATSFELGDYAESITYADEALSLLGDDAVARKSQSRLVLRKLRALILLKRFDDAKTLVASTPENYPSTDTEWRRLAQALAVHPPLESVRITSPFKPMIGDFSRTEVVGDDKPTSLFDTSLVPKQEDRQDVSFLFVNAGDARNVFATLLHLADPAINTGNTRFLFALADTNPHNSARMMVVMSILGALKDEDGKATSSSLLAALFYTYISPTIPASLYTILQQHIQAAHDALESDDLPDYLGAEPERAEAILQVLNFWLHKAQEHFPISRVRAVLDDELISTTSEDLEFFPAKLKQEAKHFRETCQLKSSLVATDGEVWRTNVTLIADTPSKLQGLVFDPFKFGSLVSATEVSDSTTLADLVSAWFIKIAKALRVLQHKIVLTVRGLPASLPEHGQPATALAATQRRYDRIHLSDYPDLVGGTLFVYTYAVPCLRPGSTSYVAWKCSSYATAFKSWNDYDLEFLAIDPDRKGVTVRQLFAVRPDNEVYAQDATSYLFDSTSISGYRRARSAGVTLEHRDLMPRERLTPWLYRLLLKTALPCAAVEAGDDDVLSPFNLGVFVKVLERLVSIGYPAHWLSDLIAEILSGTASTSARPPLSRPLRLKEVTASSSVRSLDVSFLEGELSRLLGALPFGIVDEGSQTIQHWQASFTGVELKDSVLSTYALLLSTPKPKDIERQLQALTLTKRRAAQLLGSQLVTMFSLDRNNATATFHAAGQHPPTTEASFLHVESWEVLSRACISPIPASTGS